ncbi:MAG: glycosyltransferase [Parabacteroides sp.]
MNPIKKVSIAMCTYNGEKYICEQLDSIIQQSYPIYELIVQDDNSKDGTFRILQEYARRYPFVHVYQNVPALGINANFLSCVQRATGDFIAIADQDDIWERQKIEWQMESIGDCWLSSGFSKPFSEGGIPIQFDDRVPNCSLERGIYLNCLPGHTQLFRKEFLLKIPDLQKGLDCFMYDHLFMITAAVYDKIHFCDRVLVHQRRHLSAATYGKPLNNQRSVQNMIQVLKRTFGQYWVVRPKMQLYFAKVYEFLSDFPDKGTCKRAAQQMAYLQSRHSIGAFIRLMWLCVEQRDRIFFVPEKKPLMAILRALLFPITCGDYFRWMAQDKLGKV